MPKLTLMLKFQEKHLNKVNQVNPYYQGHPAEALVKEK